MTHKPVIFIFLPNTVLHAYKPTTVHAWNMPPICPSLQLFFWVQDLWHCMRCSDFISGNGAPSLPPALSLSPPSFPAPPICDEISLSYCFAIATCAQSSKAIVLRYPHRNQFRSILCSSCYSPIDIWDTVCILMSLLNGVYWQWQGPSSSPLGPLTVFTAVDTPLREDWYL